MTLRRALLVFVLALGLTTGLRAASPAEYDQALSQVEQSLLARSRAIRADVVPQSESPGMTAQRVLAPIHSLDPPNGAPRAVDNSLLLAQIATVGKEHDPKKSAADYAALAQQINALRRALAPGAGVAQRIDPVVTARVVLSGSEYASDPLPPPSLMDRFAAWMDRMLSKLHGPTGPTPNFHVNPKALEWTFYILLGLVFVVVVWLLVRALSRRGPRARPLILDETETALVEARDTDSLLGLAEQQAKAGDYRRAFRLIYLATLIALDTGGVLRFDRSKTNWEYLRALRAAGREDVSQALTPMTREFDQVWYGFAPTTASDYARVLSQHQALQAIPRPGAS